jgi:diadenosine tetraphosphate (Ap4A) HIT family hydrolase
MDSCIACDIINGNMELPGGRIYSTVYWVVEHCIGPFGVGSIIVKLKRHCVHYWELQNEEVMEVGPLLKLITLAIEKVLKVDQRGGVISVMQGR